MMRSGACLAAALFVTGCTVAGPRPAEPAPRDRPAPRPADPTVPAVPPLVDPAGVVPGLRVGVLVNVEEARLEAGAELEIVDEGGHERGRSRAGDTWTLRRSGGGVEAAGPGQSIRSAGTLVFRPAGGADVGPEGRAPARSEAAAIRVADRAYRGAVLLLPAASGVTVVNVLDMEAYLLGVVPLEIGAGRPESEVEAVKAQAVAARTYAIRHSGRRSELGFDVFATVMDQVYGGADVEDPVSTRAVLETRGEIAVYRGEPIEAYYHSTCGGRTAALEEVWVGAPRPYLRSVSDEKPGGGWYCETSNRFQWTERWDEPALVAAIDRGLRDRGIAAGPVTRVEHLGLTGRTGSGRAEAMRVGTNLGEHTVRGDSVRWVLRPDPDRILNSAAITLFPHGTHGVSGLTVEGRGWGHGIGMCQVGALGRAREGHSYRDILAAYYPGIQIVRLYR
jgi:stage II sporulation protein D